MAPEVMCRQNHSQSVDYFAVGVIAFECMFGKRPYSGKSRKEIKENILAKQLQIEEANVPIGWSGNSVDFINKVSKQFFTCCLHFKVQLIQNSPKYRLGNNGISEIKNHPWLRDFPWQDLNKKIYKSPF